MGKIYIVDDDKDIVDALSIVLEGENHSISFQTDDENVVTNVIGYDPDIIILDVIFPEDSGAGFKIARTLRHDDKTKKIPILMLSAVNEKGSYAGTFTNRDRDDIYLPVDQFVDKPVKPQRLLELVNEMLN